jgi:5-methyltetrahydrofolate--homocysteine methyltransferase
MINRLLNPDTGKKTIDQIKNEMKELRETHLLQKEQRPHHALSLEEARAKAWHYDWHANPPPRPNLYGVFDLAPPSISELSKLIDWEYFFKGWGIEGSYPELLEDPKTGPEAHQLIEDAIAMLARAESEQWIELRGAFGLFAANSSGDDIVLYDNDTEKQEVGRLYCLRQQFNRPQGNQLSLADYVAPIESGLTDTVGCYAVSAGFGTEATARRLADEQGDYASLLIKFLADRLTDALAEYVHRLIAIQYWGIEPTLDLLGNQPAKGIRPTPGYPAYPDHSEKLTLWNVLDVKKRTGITLTETLMMQPASSSCGIILANPQADYFGVGKIQPDQLEAYARRKGTDPDLAKRWLASSMMD